MCLTCAMLVLPGAEEGRRIGERALPPAVADHHLHIQSPAITAELKVSCLRPGKGERLVCEAHVIKAGRGLSFTEAEVYAETAGQRTLVMKASATMAMVVAKS